MMLRESAKRAGEEVELRVATGLADGDGGVEHGAYLTRLAEAVARWRWDEVGDLRREGLGLMSAESVADAILVASSFNGITRVADATGIRLDPDTESTTVELRSSTGIDAFAPAGKWAT